MRDRPTDAHRRAATRALGRPIKPGHDIDHRDSNKDNNDPSNLQELSHSAHSSKTGARANRSLAKLQRALAMPRKGQKSY